jgi:anti-sigma factor RsiW
MTCDDIERDDIAEQYLGGRLSSADQQRFEEHYFDCAHCQERLRTLEEVRVELSRDPAALPALAHPDSQVATTGGGNSPAWRTWRPVAAWLAAAAVIVVAVRVVHSPEKQRGGNPAASPSTSGDVTLSASFECSARGGPAGAQPDPTPCLHPTASTPQHDRSPARIPRCDGALHGW